MTGQGEHAAEFDATIDVCDERGPHEPHERLSFPWPDSTLAQHTLWCLGRYDQERQGSHVTIRRGRVVSQRPCRFGCTDPGHPKRRFTSPGVTTGSDREASDA